MRLQSGGGAFEVNTTTEGVVMVMALGAITPTETEVAANIAWASRSGGDRADGYLGVFVDIRSAWLAAPMYYGEGRDRPVLPALFRDLPSVLLVLPTSLERARFYCWQCAMHGAIMGAFIDPDEALAWLREKGAMRWAQMERCRKRLLALQQRTLADEARDQ